MGRGDLLPDISLRSFLQELENAFWDWSSQTPGRHLAGLRLPRRAGTMSMNTAGAAPSAGLTYDTFFGAINSWITANDVLVVDAGFPLVGAQRLPISAQDGFVAQAAWLSIGYSVGAGTGVKCARPDRRAVVVVGDGAFHETCQAVSDHNANGQNTVVFVLVNGYRESESFPVARGSVQRQNAGRRISVQQAATMELLANH